MSTEDRLLRSNRQQVRDDVDDDDEEGDTESVIEESETPVSATRFIPMFYCFRWLETMTTRERVSVIINLPSGTQETYGLCVVGGGTGLQVKVELPRPMVDVKLLHQFWFDKDGQDGISPDHPRIGACVQMLKELRTSEADPVWSYATIPLPIRVETECEHEPFYYPPSVCLLYVDLKVATDKYSGASTRKPFHTMQELAGGSSSVAFTPVTPPAGRRVV